MVDELVPALVPPPTPSVARVGSTSARPDPVLPLADVAPRPRPRMLYATRMIHPNGYLSVRGIIEALGWRHRRPLSWRIVEETIAITGDEQGPRVVAHSSRLSVPVDARRAVGLKVCDEVLVAADVAADLLIVYPLTVLEAMLAYRSDDGYRR